MKFPLTPPILPQLAISAERLPEGDGWCYEPKLDGFRAIVFVDGDERLIQSRNGRPLDRYFPEVETPGVRCILDGELVVLDGHGKEDFGALQQRIHPAASRIARLAAETPARFVPFDLLADGERSLLDDPFAARRERLAALLEPIEATGSVSDAERWLAWREGVVAKRLDAGYLPGKRANMVKVKRMRTIDCVVIGWRESSAGGSVGSLVLGLYERDGDIRHVGHAAGFTAKRARELVAMVTPLATGAVHEPEPSRWSRREAAWRQLRPELVCEVMIDHVSDGRIRHGGRFQRWRDDKRPEECNVDQLDQ